MREIHIHRYICTCIPVGSQNLFPDVFSFSIALSVKEYSCFTKLRRLHIAVDKVYQNVSFRTGFCKHLFYQPGGLNNLGDLYWPRFRWSKQLGRFILATIMFCITSISILFIRILNNYGGRTHLAHMATCTCPLGTHDHVHQYT